MNDEYQTMIEETKTETKLVPVTKRYRKKNNENRDTAKQLDDLNNNINKLNQVMTKEAKKHSNN